VWSTRAAVCKSKLYGVNYFLGFQVGLQLLNLTSLINKQELMLRVMGVDAKESDPGRFTVFAARSLLAIDEFRVC
jgi:hypothetical protein